MNNSCATHPLLRKCFLLFFFFLSFFFLREMLSIRIRQELYEDFFFNVCFPVVLPFNLKLLGCSQTLLQAPLMRQKLW